MGNVNLKGMAAGTYPQAIQASLSPFPDDGRGSDHPFDLAEFLRNDNHAAAGTLTVSQAPLTITADSHSKVYGDAVPAFSVAYAGFVNGDTPLSLSGTLTFSGATQSSPVAGSPYAILPGGLSSPNYAITFVPGKLTVIVAPLTVTADSGTKLYSDLPNLTASYAGFVLGETPAVLGGTLAISGVSTSSPVAGSPYTLTPSGLTSPNYTITYGTGTETVTPAPLTVTADVINTVYGQTPVFTASYAGFVLGETPAALGGSLTFTSPATATSTVSGSPYLITPSGLTSTNYAITYVPGVDIVGPAAVLVTPTNIAPVTYGAGSLTVTAKLTALPPSFASVGEGQAVLSVMDSNGNPAGTPVSATVSNGVASATFPLDAGLNAGSYSIQATFAEGSQAANFKSAPVAMSATFTILPAPLTITADNQTTIYGAPLPTYTASYTGAVFGQTLAALSGTLALTSPATMLSSVAGSPYPITPSGLSSNNYAITYVPGTLTMSPASVSVTSANVSATYGDASVSISAVVKATSPSAAPVNEGAVGFIVSDSGGADVTGGVSGTVVSGATTASLLLPANGYGGVYSVQAVYFGNGFTSNFTSALAPIVTLTISNPMPMATYLSQPSATAGSSSNLVVIGSGFVPASVINFGPTVAATTFTSANQLSAAVPGSLAPGAFDISVSSVGPGGGTSGTLSFFLTQPGVSASASSGVSSGVSGQASVTVGGSQPYGPGSVNGLAYGAGTLTLAQYNAMPVSAPAFGPEGGWFDIHVSPANSFSVVVVTTCNLGSGHEAMWWTGSAWAPMSNQAWNPNSGCVTMRFDQITSPNISQLNGTEAEIWGWANAVGVPTCVGDEFVGAYGRLPQSIPELVNWGDSVGIRDPNSGNWSGNCAPSLSSPQAPPPGDGEFQRSNDGRVIPDWTSFDNEIRSVGYPGPYDHGSQEIGAYERACQCTLIPTGGPAPVLCDSGYMTSRNGPKTLDQMRSELRGAGYPNWQWAGEGEIVEVYARTSQGTVSLCSQSQPQPSAATPTPSPQPNPSSYPLAPGIPSIPFPAPFCSVLMVVGNIFIGMIGGQPAYNCGSASSNAGAQATATAQAQATATAQAQATATPTPARQVAVIGKYPGYLQYQNDPRYDLFNIDTNGMTDLAIRAANTAWVLGHTNRETHF